MKRSDWIGVVGSVTRVDSRVSDLQFVNDQLTVADRVSPTTTTTTAIQHAFFAQHCMVSSWSSDRKNMQTVALISMKHPFHYDE